ncbi:hypothetical protein DL98DRAFT_120067 [Cadophora sp. DSE1049]|nr:hypothetical protein DL98DRAFT_120067 [Cadophora sp. DSE1049]
MRRLVADSTSALVLALPPMLMATWHQHRSSYIYIVQAHHSKSDQIKSRSKNAWPASSPIKAIGMPKIASKANREKTKDICMLIYFLPSHLLLFSQVELLIFRFHLLFSLQSLIFFPSRSYNVSELNPTSPLSHQG